MNNKKVSNILKSFNSKILKGKIIPASDKSISHRSLIISALAIGESKIKNLLDSDDVYCTVSALRILGVKIRKNTKNDWTVMGVGLCGFTQPEENVFTVSATDEVVYVDSGYVSLITGLNLTIAFLSYFPLFPK